MTTSVLESIPVLTASTPMSLNTASICAAIKSKGTSWMEVTATVFWAVSAVSTLIPKPPSRVMVFRSAWMPAPPPESEPAMVNILLVMENSGF